MLNISQNGSTIGERGSYVGEIIRDVEHPPRSKSDYRENYWMLRKLY